VIHIANPTIVSENGMYGAGPADSGSACNDATTTTPASATPNVRPTSANVAPKIAAVNAASRIVEKGASATPVGAQVIRSICTPSWRGSEGPGTSVLELVIVTTAPLEDRAGRTIVAS